ncbi:hypothetical protein D3C81_1427160 [compost metagenome]
MTPRGTGRRLAPVRAAVEESRLGDELPAGIAGGAGEVGPLRGEDAAPGITLERIASDGVVLNFSGYRFRPQR